MAAKIIDISDYDRLRGDPNLVIGVETISPKLAAEWLKANRLNRPVRQAHVNFLAREIEEGKWQLNGQAIIICENEDVLDGQHRLKAIIEAGVSIKTLVIYGVKKEAFKTIDTGIVRTSSDALVVFFPGRGSLTCKTIGSAIPWCKALERKTCHVKTKTSNEQAIAYVNEHPSLWQCAAEVLAYPKDTRVISAAMATAAYEMFQRKDVEVARDFIRAVCTGEMIGKDDPEYILRTMLGRDAASIQRYPNAIRMRMIVKAWNLKRRQVPIATRQAVAVHAKDPEEIIIL